MRIGSLAGISIDWSAVEAALRRTMNDAAREALDYACDYAVTNAETAVDNGLGALSRAAAKLSGGMVAVSASRSGIRVSDPTDRVISGLRNRLGTTLPRVKRGTPDIFYPSLGAKTPQTRSKSGFAGFFNFFLIGGKLTLSHFPMARPYLRGTSHARRKSTQYPEASERRVSF